MHETEPSAVSVAHLFRTIGKYRSVILISLLAVIFGYALIALGIFIASPAVVTTSLPFRLEFDGAERGEYPNGLKFSTAEIVATPVLNRVFEDNNLGRFMTFPAFKESVFIIESNREMGRLQTEFQNRLADPKLNPVDRERISREYQDRIDSLSHTEYALVLMHESLVKRLPRDLRQKLLTDVLSRWASVADVEKGALKYRQPVLTTNVVQPVNVGGEQIIGLDILRSRVNRVLANINELMKIPGSETARVGPEKISLAEIRVGLEDVRRFQIEPLIVQIYQRGLINDPRLVNSYFETQKAATQRELGEAKARVSMLQASFGTYVGRPANGGSTAGSRDPAQTSDRQGGQSGGEQSVVPQVSDSFLDRVVRMVSETQDVGYRQKLLDSMNDEALKHLGPAEKEAQYYTAVSAQMQSARSPSDPSARPERLRSIEEARAAAQRDVVRAVEQVSEVYRVLSLNLNPDTLLYTRTAPFRTQSARTVSLGRLALIGLGLLLLSIPIIVMGCLIHARVREEEDVERSEDLPHAVRDA